jgi:hypothetical protein
MLLHVQPKSVAMPVLVLAIPALRFILILAMPSTALGKM